MDCADVAMEHTTILKRGERIAKCRNTVLTPLRNKCALLLRVLRRCIAACPRAHDARGPSAGGSAQGLAVAATAGPQTWPPPGRPRLPRS
eukprot:5867300-Pyramimonas_sp.AAC.1